MKYYKYGICLKRLTKNDIELLRLKRNSHEVRQFMDYKDDITTEMQEKWFSKINNLENFYFLIEYKDEIIGLLHDSNINWENKSSDSGLYLWEHKYVNTFVPTLVSLFSIEVAFTILNWTKTSIKIMNDNIHAIEYAKMLGFVRENIQPKENSSLFFLNRENFESSTKKVRKAAIVYAEKTKDKWVVVHLEPDDYDNGIAQKIEENIMSDLPNFIKKKTKKGMFYIKK